MKRFAPFVLAAVVAAAMFAGCSSNNNSPAPAANPPAPAQEAAPEPASEPVAENGAGGPDSYSTGLGIITTFGGAHTKEATAEAEGVAEVDSTVVALTLDGSGVITNISLDVAQTSAKFDAVGKITSDVSGAAISKAEKREAYGMKKASAIEKEWFEQAAGFEAWATGKTVAEVMALPVNAEGHTTDTDVAASVSIGVSEFKEAVEKAARNIKTEPIDGAYKTGLGIVTSYGGSHTKEATAEADGVIEIDSTIVALTVDGNDVIKMISLDVAQSSVKFDASGKITSDVSAQAPSKGEKRETYGMKNASKIEKEWFEQAAAFEAWATGKTVAEVLALPVNGEGHTTDADVAASVSIGVSEFKEAVEKAFKNAK